MEEIEMKIEIKNATKDDFEYFCKLRSNRNLIKVTELNCTKNTVITCVSFKQSEKEENVIIDLEEVRFLNFTVKV